MAVPAGERREAVTRIELGGEPVLCSRQVYPDDLSHPCFATPVEEMREGGILDAAIEDAAGKQKDCNRQPRLDARPEEDADDAAGAEAIGVVEAIGIVAGRSSSASSSGRASR